MSDQSILVYKVGTLRRRSENPTESLRKAIPPMVDTIACMKVNFRYS